VAPWVRQILLRHYASGSDGSRTVMPAFGHHEDRIPTHGDEPTREAAMAAFAKIWRRE
jgi:hypothetical protein